jgi:hypothetical protein
MIKERTQTKGAGEQGDKDLDLGEMKRLEVWVYKLFSSQITIIRMRWNAIKIVVGKPEGKKTT